ncbi:MAG: TonB-dependent receptor, partial [Bryobacterales bacterium]|nr:TonB-dependent receptor [Bryobacterales bacterium]
MDIRFLAPICMLVAAAAAQAQQSDVSGPSAEQGSLQEVVVTAQRREERLQDVPVAVTAIGEEQLAMRRIQNVNDLSGLAPNISVLPAAVSNTGFQISIRGAVQQNPALYWDPTVGLYLDGVYVGKSTGNVFDVVDLERVEVLRGPQGTLYGRNTLAGAVNLITHQPTGELGGNVQLDLGNYSLRTAKASLDLPRFGIASVSIGARKEERDGTTRTTAGSSVSELDTRDSTSARIAVNLDFSRAFRAAYRFDYSDIDQTPLHSYLSRANPSVLPFLQPFVTHERLKTVSIDAPAFERSKIYGHALTLTWDVNDSNTLKSISAYRKLKWSDSADFDGSPVPVAYLARASNYDAYSQELQLVGATGRFSYVGGLYYFKDDSYTSNPQHFFFGTVNYDSRYGSGTEAWAAYGQVDFKATDALTLTAGLRYTSEKKEIERQLAFQALPALPVFATLIPPGTTAEETFTDTTPVFIVAYKFTDLVNVYAKYAEGFKSGGFNGEYGDPDPSPAGVAFNVQETRTPFQPEKMKSYELGFKTSFAGGRGVVNAAIFQNDTDDLQLSVFRNIGAFSSVIRNAGKATARGLEIEAMWVPTDALRFQASYGYLDGKYDQYMDAGVNEADNRAFIHAPKNSYNLVADARLARTPWGDLRGMIDYRWTDDYYTYPYQLASSGPRYNPAVAIAGDTRITSYGVLNARLALADIALGSVRADVALWGRNLADEEHIINNIDFGPAFGSMTPAYYLEPRTYG